MLKSIFCAIICLASAHAAAQAALTDVEVRWLKAGSGVLAYAKQLKLPIDIIVQPQARPGDVPFAMGFDGGRCKLVLSMRGNAQAETILEAVPPAQRGLMIEAMTAHEVGHCWRYVNGEWHSLPAGFVEVSEEFSADATLLEASKTMRETRREEGFADLVALAWIKRQHPGQYAAVYAWLEAVRHELPAGASSHGTLGWIRLARDGLAFQDSGTPFDQAGQLWNQGLMEDK